jgi:hypothetical protein
MRIIGLWVGELEVEDGRAALIFGFISFVIIEVGLLCFHWDIVFRSK